MDLVGPLKKTPRGNKYIVTLTDYFSKWAEAALLPDKSAVGVAKFIYSVSDNFQLSSKPPTILQYNYISSLSNRSCVVMDVLISSSQTRGESLLM